MNKHFIHIQMANKHRTRCLTSLATREVQMKTKIKYHCTPIRMGKIKIRGNTTGEGVEKREPLCNVACMLSRFSRVQLFATLWTVARQAPLSMGFSRPEYWSGLPFPSPGNLPNPEIKPVSLKSPALASRFFTTSSTTCS